MARAKRGAGSATGGGKVGAAAAPLAPAALVAPQTRPGLMPGATSSTSPVPPTSPLVALEHRLNDYTLSTSPRGCLVTIRNTCTPDREALIVAAGVHFWFYEFPAFPNNGDPTTSDYMAGPVHVEVQPGATVPFRFSDWRKPVWKVAVGIRVMFGNPNGYPPASYENYFWEMVFPLPSDTRVAQPIHPSVGEVHLDFRLKRSQPVPTRPVAAFPPGGVIGGGAQVTPPGTIAWPPIPGPPASPVTTWFELAERPR